MTRPPRRAVVVRALPNSVVDEIGSGARLGPATLLGGFCEAAVDFERSHGAGLRSFRAPSKQAARLSHDPWVDRDELAFSAI